jgi:endonuclease/exonuclease/phosphatase family metal-dependent hydrolase
MLMPRRILLRGLLAALAIGALFLALFVANGLDRSWRVPVIVHGSAPLAPPPGQELRVFAFNAAKCGFHHGGLEFASAEEVRARLDRIASSIRAEEADLVALSEVVFEAGPVPLDQVAYLAEAAGFARHVSAENYSFGLPFYRIRSGNALLAKVELHTPEVLQLAGGTPFWAPTGNRRALFVELELDGHPLLVGSLRNDSFDLANNLRQTRELLAHIGARPALLAGDFNAQPHDDSLRELAATGAFTALATSPPTFPTRAPTRRIDHVFAPATCTLVEHHVVDTGVSDHLAVVATFRRP